MRLILNKKIILFAILSFMALNVQAKKTTKLGSKNEANIVVILDDVYTDVRDYSTNEFPSVLDDSIGNTIKNRMLIVIALLIFITISFKVLIVIGNPNEEFSKHMFLKPLMLIIFLMFYPTVMGLVNDVLELVTFRNIAQSTVQITEMNRNSNRGAVLMPGDDLGSSIINHPDEIKSKVFDATTTELIRSAELRSKWEVTQMILKAKAENRELTDDEKVKAYEEAERKLEGSGAVKGFQSIIYWTADKISLVMRIIQTVILCVLFIGGPIAITLETVFPGTLKKWFGIFVHTHLWTPIIFIIDIVSAKINLHLNSYDAGGSAYVVTFVVQVVIIALYIIIAKITSYFIQSQEGGGVLGAMSFKTLQYLRQGSKTAMGGSGGLMGAFKGTIKGGNA